MDRRRALTAGLLLALLTGCGGHRTTVGSTGSDANTSTGQARATFTMRWPERNSRLVPTAANSVKVTLTYGSTWTREQTADRPAGGGFSTIAFDNVPVGSVVATATAHPEAGAKGVAQASGSVTITTTAGQAASVPLTMASTVTRLEVTGPARLMGGTTGQYQAAARNATGEVVLVPTATWRSTSGGDKAALDTVSADGTQASIKWLAPGKAAFEVAVEQVTGDAATVVTGQVTVGLLGGLAQSPWPKFRGDAQNTGRGMGRGATGSLRWQFTTGSYVESSPVIGVDGTVYVASYDHKVYALDGSTGAKRWEFATGGIVHSTPAIGADGTVYVRSGDGYVYALDGSTGAKCWAFDTGGGHGAGPVVDGNGSSPAIGADGTVYALAAGTVCAVDGSTGAKRWAFATGGAVYSSPAMGADGTVYVGASDGAFYALDGSTGTTHWGFATGGFVESSPAIGADGTVYVGADDGRIYALGSTGAKRWDSAVGALFRLRSCPAVGSDGTIYVGADDGKVHALDGQTGAKRWEFAVGATVLSSPAVGADGTIYIGADDGKVYALDGSAGTGLWAFATGSGQVRSSPAIGADGTVYFGSTDGKVYAIK